MRAAHTYTLALAAAALLLSPAANSFAAETPACPNQQAREQNNSTSLADCRAYEMVSPLDKNGGNISPIDGVQNGGVVQATPDGSKITYASLASFGSEPKGAPIGGQYLATRGAEGWSTQNISPPQTTPGALNGEGAIYKAFSADLSQGLQFADPLSPPLGGAPEGYTNYYLANLEGAGIQATVTATPPEANSSFFITFAGATPDLQHSVYTTPAALTPGATRGIAENRPNIYEWSHGQLQAINVPPEPVAPGETLTGAFYQGISNDGATVFWTSGLEAGERLYAREDLNTSQPKTVELDARLSSNGSFLAASASGSKAFFVGSRELYEYDLSTEKLTDLTPTPNPGEAGLMGVLGASEDGAYIYFVASGALAQGAEQQECQNANSETGCNLYVWHEGGGITFIGRLTGADNIRGQEGGPGARDWGIFPRRTARVSPDGRSVVFMSEVSLTGYDNAGATCVPEVNGAGQVSGFAPGKCQEVYLYEVGSGLRCVSCNSSGAAPVGPSEIQGATNFTHSEAIYDSRLLTDGAPSADGHNDGARVFFNSYDALVPRDTNGKEDVYQWESNGTGSCVLVAGCVSLISGGASDESSSFMDASANGSDVFFRTDQQLVGGDTDEQFDLYDAREDGGVVHPPELACTGTGCQGLPGAQPIFATPATQTFNGEGNFEAPAGGGRAPNPPVKPKALTNAQKLANALKACQRQPKKKQAKCEAEARKRYAARAAKKRKGK
jgi:hypothetical protein